MKELQNILDIPAVYIDHEAAAGWAVGETKTHILVAMPTKGDAGRIGFDGALSLGSASSGNPLYFEGKRIVATSYEVGANGVPLFIILAYAKEIIVWLAAVIPLIDGFLPTLIRWWNMVFRKKKLEGRAAAAYAEVKPRGAELLALTWRVTDKETWAEASEPLNRL